MKYKSIFEITTEDIKELIEEHLDLVFYRARTISVSLLTILYDLPYTDYFYDVIKNHITKKVSKVLKEWESEGKLVIYSTSNRGNLYKKVNKK